MTTRTHVIGDVKMKVVHNEDSGRHIALIQGEDIIIMSIDQAREAAAVIAEV